MVGLGDRPRAVRLDRAARPGVSYLVLPLNVQLASTGAENPPMDRTAEPGGRRSSTSPHDRQAMTTTQRTGTRPRHEAPPPRRPRRRSRLLGRAIECACVSDLLVN